MFECIAHQRRYIVKHVKIYNFAAHLKRVDESTNRQEVNTKSRYVKMSFSLPVNQSLHCTPNRDTGKLETAHAVFCAGSTNNKPKALSSFIFYSRCGSGILLQDEGESVHYSILPHCYGPLACCRACNILNSCSTGLVMVNAKPHRLVAKQ